MEKSNGGKREREREMLDACCICRPPKRSLRYVVVHVVTVWEIQRSLSPLRSKQKKKERKKERNTLTWYRKQIPIVWWVILRFQYTKKNRNRINDGREVRRRFHCVVVARFDETPLLHNNKRQTPDFFYSITATSNINVPV